MTSTDRYGDDSDTPVLTSRSDGSEVRDIAGPSGQLVALKDGAALTYQLRDLQGSIVATVPSGAAGGRPSAQTAYDPFGIVTSPTPNVIDWAKGTAGYGWLGAHQRSTEFEQYQGSGSPMEMGVRVYLPAAGRFLQTDPVDGGSANAYDYANADPVNSTDLTGTEPDDPYRWAFESTAILRNIFSGREVMRVQVRFRVSFNGKRVNVNYSAQRISGTGRVSGLSVRCREEHWPRDNGCGRRGGGRSSFILNDSANYHLDFSFEGWAGVTWATGGGRTPQFSCRPSRVRACEFN